MSVNPHRTFVNVQGASVIVEKASVNLQMVSVKVHRATVKPQRVPLKAQNDYMAWSRFLLIVLSPFLFLQSIFLKMKSSQKWEVTVELFIFNNYQISMCIRLVMYEQ